MKSKKTIILCLSLVLLTLPLMGCITDDSKSTVNPLTQQLATLQSQMTTAVADISELKKEIVKKEDRSRVDGLVVSLGAGSAGAGYSKAEVYTKDEVRKIVADAISALKDEKPWSSNSPGANNNNNSSIISTNGDLDLIVERAPGDDEVWVNDNIPVEWRLTVKNRSLSGTYFRINANFDTTETAAVIASAQVIPSYGQGTIIFTPNPLTTTTAVTNLSFTSQVSASNGKIWIPKNSEQSLYLVFKVDYADVIVTGKRWSWDFSIKQLN